MRVADSAMRLSGRATWFAALGERSVLGLDSECKAGTPGGIRTYDRIRSSVLGRRYEPIV